MISLFSTQSKTTALSLLLLTSSCHRTVASISSSSCSSSSSSSQKVANDPILLSGGLINLGNTCYLNSQLECAYHIPFVRNLIVNPQLDPSEDDDDMEEQESLPSETSNPSIALIALNNLFTTMQKASKRGNNDPTLSPSVSTSILCRSLGINVYEQQDSQEFWKLLLPELDYPPLVGLYRGRYESYIAALDGSQREKKRFEIFLDVSLDVSNFDSAYDSLEDMFTGGELLSEKEGNGWRPAKGEDKVDALKGNTLPRTGLPKILQLHLMRFSYDWQTQVMSKINDRFTFGKELDLSKICHDDKTEGKGSNDDLIYDLQSVVVHAGEYGSGHYYAYVRPDIRKNMWYRYDDDRVTEVPFKQVKDDAFGGHVVSKKKKGTHAKEGFWARMLGSPNRKNFGWGGRTSSAYMLQYVRRSDIPLLYDYSN